MTINVHFISPDGETTQSVEAMEGDDLLSVAQAAGQPLEGTCEGQMACSTCHVVVAQKWFGKLRKATEDEEDMLDQAFFVEDNSRLSCQIRISESIDGIQLKLAPVS